MAVAFSFGKQGGFMNNFFATPEGAWGDGSVHLTITGIVIVVVIIALLLIIAAFVRQKNASRKATLTTKQLVYSAVAIALAVVCSMIKLFEMPMGGSVTLLSMLFYRSDRILVWPLCRHHDSRCIWSGTVCNGTDLLHDPTDAA